jgi:hypothetical protein
VNKDDIVKITIAKNSGLCNEDGIKAYLAWDESKSVTWSATDVTDLSDCELSALGGLWQEYGNEIIAYIQKKTIESIFLGNRAWSSMNYQGFTDFPW